MSLPKIAVPKYKLTIPSTQKQVSFRPFLTKEQKIMLVALESQDIRQITDSLLHTVQACCDAGDAGDLATFDVEYMFTQIRSKAVGEKSQIKVECDQCEHENIVAIDLDTIQVDVKGDNNVQLTDDVSLTMRYPTYKRLQTLNIANLTRSEQIWETLKVCVESIETEDESLTADDHPPAELDEFLGNLNTEQFDRLSTWLEEMPKLVKNIDYKCSECDKQHNLKLEGIQDFF